ncbi:hypothetical protein K461DRAFT_292993 [Myriangium duriaei CBS 260.36]|uniref:DUF7514 domain-containing protein n=1 Tax=Myriangium duriaei CBS 260.36 TaxID=1168546 RepID=A0A9P4J3A6_9PEZI|nr:hypothetical protein K461DRAFT_292993 [Myriangium duriaei CBS 260.36]
MQADEFEGASAGRPHSTVPPVMNGTLRPGIQEAVGSAIDESNSEFDPNLVSKITEQVLNLLKKEKESQQAPATVPDPAATPRQASQTTSRLTRTGSTSSATPVQRPQNGAQQTYNEPPTTLHQPVPMGARQPAPASPTSPASSQMPSRYTPPSPNRYATSSRGSSSPEPPYSDTASHTSKDARNSRRDSKSSMSGQEDMSASRQRMRPVRIPSSVEETSLEKAWKPLFDNGKPTARLGQFLRGLAKHIIEDCKPQNSIVLTPGKLADFFKVTEVSAEMYPWTTIFGGKLTNLAISRLFLHLRCQHHLVQFGDQDTPTIPGLTPAGFEHFMTMLIQAYPDQEFQRLSKAVKNMPISNADSPSERFPKELTRRLFPATGDTTQGQRLTAAVSLDPSIHLNHTNPLPPPPTSQPTNSNAAPASVFTERERNPYSNSFSSAIDDEDLRSGPIPMPIERERKPYVAREGGGKVYEDGRGVSNAPRSESGTRSMRSNTTTSGASAPFPQHQATRPIDMTNSAPRSHRMSVNGPPTGRYMNSPGQSFQNTYTRSEGNNVSDIPSAYYASNMGDHDDPPRESRRSFRRQNTEDEMARGFSAPQRGGPGPGPPGPGYDYPNGNGYGPRGYPGADLYGSFPGQGPPPHAPRY